MDFKPSIILPVPEAEDFEDEPPYVYIPVPSGIVDMGIELLQCFLTQWKPEEGVTPDERVWDAMAISGAQMLSGLMAAWAAHYHGSGLRALVEQIDHYCNQRDVVDPY